MFFSTFIIFTHNSVVNTEYKISESEVIPHLREAQHKALQTFSFEAERLVPQMVIGYNRKVFVFFYYEHCRR